MKKKKPNFGLFFGESIEGLQEKLKLPSATAVKLSSDWEDEVNSFEQETISPWRLVPVFVAISLILVFLAASAFKLQIINGTNFLNKSEGNHVLVKINHASRGVIYDRNGKIIARNKPGFRIAIRKIDLPKNWETSVAEVAKLVNLKPQELSDKIAKATTDSVTLATNLNNDQVITLKTNQEKYPWLDVEIYPIREYLYGEIVAPLIGYTSEASVEDLKNTDITPYSAGDQVGKAGVEASFEKQLRGSNGYTLAKVDSKGKSQGILFETKPLAGSDITLSIDIDLQKYVYDTLNQMLKDKGGQGASSIVQDPKTGEVLAMVSLPSYDNNAFTKPLTNDQYQIIVNNPGQLLLNRPLGSSFPPGSTFKLVVATAGLETGTVTKDTKILDTGFVKLGDVTFNNWLWTDHHQTEGEISMVRAISRSNDTYFYNLGERLGQEKIAQFAREFGFGSKTGIDLPGETAGLVPDSAWKESVFNQVWFPGETLNFAIGQGYLLVTPLQLNQMTSTFANGGSVIKPTILHGSAIKVVRKDFIKPDTLSVIREGMYQNTVGDGNVAYLFRDFRIKTAGKTGSAESGGENKPHSWYTAYGPYDNPKISVTVMFERAGNGSEISAPVIKNIFNWYLKN